MVCVVVAEQQRRLEDEPSAHAEPPSPGLVSSDNNVFPAADGAFKELPLALPMEGFCLS